MLAGELRARGLDVLTTREPGGTPLGRRLREVFLESEETVSPLAELLLFAADRAQHVELTIKPALAEGRIVISDRYADATRAYQGGGRGFSRETIEAVISLATGGLMPDLTVFFDIPVEAALDRMTPQPDEAHRRNNRMDAETAEFYRRVRETYVELVRSEPGRFVIIDANRPVSEIQSELVTCVTDFLARGDAAVGQPN